MACAATAFASAGDAHSVDWTAVGRWTLLVFCAIVLARPLCAGLRALARLAVPALFAFLLLSLGMFATTPNGGTPTREEKERIRAELAAAEAERAAMGGILVGGGGFAAPSESESSGSGDPTNLCFTSFSRTPSNVEYSVAFNASAVPYGSRIELHEKEFALTNGFSPVVQHVVGVGQTNLFGAVARGTNAPPAAFYGLFADALSIGFPGIPTVVRQSTGRRLSVATKSDAIPVSVSRSERPEEYPPYDPDFAADPFYPVDGIEFDQTNSTVAAESTGAFTLATGDELVVLSPSLSFGTSHAYAGDTLSYDETSDTYRIESAYPIEEPCLWEGWHSGTNGAFGCTCVPELSLGADVSAYPEITNVVTVVDDVAYAKVFLGQTLVWSNSCEHAKWLADFGRSDVLSRDGCSECSSCAEGNCDAFDGPSVGSVRFRVSLGSPSDGKVSGFLWFSRDDVFQPSPSSFSLLARRDASVTDTTSNGTRTVVCSDRGGLTLALSPIEGGVKIVTTFTASGESNRTWRITREGDAMRFRKYSAGGNMMSDVAYSRVDGTWSVLDNVSGLSTTTVSSGNVLSDANDWTRTVETVVSCGSVTGSHVRITSRLFADGWESDGPVVRETERRERRADGSWSVACASYWESTGRTRMAWGDDRAWSWTEWDDLGRETFRLDQRDGSAAPEDMTWYSLEQLPGSAAFATVIEYEPHAGDSCRRSDRDKPRTVSRYATGGAGGPVLIGRTWTVYSAGTAPDGRPTVTETTIRACRGDAQMSDASNAVSVVTRYDDESSLVPYILRGETLSQTDEDGVATTNVFSISGDILSHSSCKSYSSHPYPTYLYDERDLDYGLTLFESTRLAANPSVEFDSRRHTYDSRRRLVSTEYGDGSSETNAYDCCKLRFRIDRAGAKTLRSAKTGQDGLYYAEEEVYFAQLPRGGDYRPDDFNFGGFQNAFRVTQHYFDAFGRETNTIVRAATSQGAATNAWSTYSHGYRTAETNSFPCGTSDFSVRIDPRGLVTTTREFETQACSLSVVEERLPGAAEPDVVVTNLSYRGGGSVSIRRFGGAGSSTSLGDGDPRRCGVPPRQAGGNVVVRRSFTEYDADGMRRGYIVTESDDCGTVTNSVTTFDFLGRTVLAATPTSCVSNLYEDASTRVFASIDLMSGVASTNLYDECGEVSGAVSRGVRSESATRYEESDGAWWRVDSQTLSANGATNSVSESRTQLTGLSDALRSRTRRYEDGVLLESAESSFDPSSLDLAETVVSATEGTAVRRSRFGRTLEEATPAGTTWTYYDYFGNPFYDKYALSPGGTAYKGGIREYGDAGDLTDDGTFAGGAHSSVRWRHYGYDARGNRVTSENELGETVETTRDAEGRALSEDGDTYPLCHGYDSSGRRVSLLTTRDGESWDETRWAYDVATGSCTNKVYADGSAEAYSYTSDALPLRRTSPDGDWTENVYDANRRLAGETSNDPSCEYALALDSFGRTVAASNSVARYTYALANRGVATNEAASVGPESFSVARSVDQYGRVAAFSRDGIEDMVVYDNSSGTLASVSNAEAVATYAYTDDLLDAGFTLALAGGCVFSREVHRNNLHFRGQVHAVTNVSPAATNAFRYSYDALSRPVSRNSDAFAYNRRGEVTNAVVSTGGGQPSASAYSYDMIGNNYQTVSDGGYTVFMTDAANRPTGWSDDQSRYIVATCDGSGNLIRAEPYVGVEADTLDFTYDAKSRFVSVSRRPYGESDFQLVVSNRYDHLGRRVQKITPGATHTYFYDGWLLVKETRHPAASQLRSDAAGSRVSLEEDVIEYHWGKDLSGTIGGAGGVGGLLYLTISNSSTPNSSTRELYVPWYDAYGNILGYWDAEGHVVAEYTYDAFGKLIASSGPMADVFSLRYSTKYFDPETGLYYYGRRFYSPELMRWITRDPIGEEGGVNLYAMCGNNIISRFDSLGLTKVELSTEIENRNSEHGLLPFAAIRMQVVEPPDKGNKLYFIQLARDKGSEWKIDNVKSVAGPYYYTQEQMRQFSSQNANGQIVYTLYDSPGGQLDYVDFITAAVEVSRSCGMFPDKITKKKINFRCSDTVDVLAHKCWRFNPKFNPRYDFKPASAGEKQPPVASIMAKLLENNRWRVGICPDVTITVKRH